jgi:hypothetical protein
VGENVLDVLRVIFMVSDLEGLNLTSHLSAHKEICLHHLEESHRQVLDDRRLNKGWKHQ